VVHGVEAAVVLVPLEEREVGDPEKIVAALRYQIPLATELESERSERGEDHLLGGSDGEQEIALAGATRVVNVSVVEPYLKAIRRMPDPTLEYRRADPIRHRTVARNYPQITDPADLETLMAEENVLFGLENLKTYGVVQRALQEDKVRLHGWMFKISTAKLFAYNSEIGQFEPLTPPAGR